MVTQPLLGAFGFIWPAQRTSSRSLSFPRPDCRPIFLRRSSALPMSFGRPMPQISFLRGNAGARAPAHWNEMYLT